MTTKASIVHSFSDEKNVPIFSWSLVIILAVFILLGIGTGYLLSLQSSNAVTTTASSQSIQVGVSYGSDDTTTFKDTAEGVLQKGGIKGEGQYHLVRSGGDSQNVYLVSSSVDLSLFIGHTVKVWGQTQKAQYAGWLMDVGKVEVEQ